MGRRFRVRLDELLDDAEVRPGLLRGLVPRPHASADPGPSRLAGARVGWASLLVYCNRTTLIS